MAPASDSPAGGVWGALATRWRLKTIGGGGTGKAGSGSAGPGRLAGVGAFSRGSRANDEAGGRGGLIGRLLVGVAVTRSWGRQENFGWFWTLGWLPAGGDP